MAAGIEESVLGGGQPREKLIELAQRRKRTASSCNFHLQALLQPSTVSLGTTVCPGALWGNYMLKSAELLQASLKNSTKLTSSITDE